jgi:CubicO group peptidase (beta-lactamase class C family)
MSISTRDMARLGLLMARTGNWNGKQLVPADWVRATTTLITPFDEINPTGMRIRGRPDRWGYGMLWRVWDAPVFPGNIFGNSSGTAGDFAGQIPPNRMPYGG